MRRILQFLFPILGLIILAWVWSVSINANGGLVATFASSQPIGTIYNLVRLAGLTTFVLVSFQIATGPYMKLWERLYGPNFYRFHAFEGTLTLVFASLHPSLLLLYAVVSQTPYLELVHAYPWQYYLGPTAWFFMVITVSTAAATILWRSNRFQRWWHVIHLANYLVFVLGFVHSISIGSDVADPLSPLRLLWYTFAAVAVAGLLYRRVYRVFREKNPGLD